MKQSPSLEFLKNLRPKGPWLLTAFDLGDAPIEVIVTTIPAQAEKFIGLHNGKRNLYYGLNPSNPNLRRKPKKADIVSAEFVHADLDPRDDEKPEDAKRRYMEAIDSFHLSPSAVVDSGNGLQVLFRLDASVESDRFRDVEACSKAVTEALGGTAGTQNVDRLLRLPGTHNLPTKAKKLRGRKRCAAKTISMKSTRYSLDDFPKPTLPALKPNAALELDWDEVEKYRTQINITGNVPTRNRKALIILESDGDPADVSQELIEADLLKKPYGSRSEMVMALAASLLAARMPREQVAAVLQSDFPCNAHIAEQKNPQRAITQILSKTFVPNQPDWPDPNRDGSPRRTMVNAIAGIEALNIECKQDTFHHRILITYAGVEHLALQHEVTDDNILKMRLMMAKQLGFDPEDKTMRDAVQCLALNNRFDPLVDYLQTAQGEWDRVPRLDRLAADYFNVNDTPLNCAIGRITMIAAVRRARHPGCKFDTITVFEGPEGYGKSTALRVLAGDDYFSDESIIGRDSREVQEQLTGVWIHENAELAGLRKADIEKVKAFASRQVDKARPAYGRHPVSQKRRSIEVGTTNSSQYLQSQNGNRRFLPMTVCSQIDIQKLKRDRTQLWGEAAQREADGEAIIVPQELWAAAAIAQGERRVPDPWEDMLEAFLPEHVVISGSREKVSSSALLTELTGKGNDRSAAMRLPAVMQQLGWTKGKITIGGNQVNGYWRLDPIVNREF